MGMFWGVGGMGREGVGGIGGLRNEEKIWF